MGKANDALDDFIDSIPHHKLEGIPDQPGTLFKDQNYRLDVQGVTNLACTTQSRETAS